MSDWMMVDNMVLNNAAPARPESKNKGQRWRHTLVVVFLLLSSMRLARGVEAQRGLSPFRIGALTSSWGPTPSIVGLRDGLVELGYREDEHFVIGVRFTQGDVEALPAAARELVQYGVDLILVSEDHSAKAAQQATREVPIVFATVSDPVGLGLIQSFARPGGNITGIADLARTLGPKRLQVFLELLPHMKRVLILYDADDTNAKAEAEVYHEAAQLLGIELVRQEVHTTTEAQAFLSTARQSGIDGILAPTCCALNIPGLMLAATTQHGIPAIFEAAFWVERGALASYGADYYASGKQAARLVDKLLKGAKPAELPVEVNPNIEFAINLKTVKALGLTIAPEVLFQADKIVR
jgi:putative tryptophan/tyrosine transport system substrate-binding protein